MGMLCYGRELVLNSRVENVLTVMRWRDITVFLFSLPLTALETSSWTAEPSLFFFFVTVVPFLSNVMGLYWGRLLNFLSNSSSSFPSLTGEVTTLLLKNKGVQSRFRESLDFLPLLETSQLCGFKNLELWNPMYLQCCPLWLIYIKNIFLQKTFSSTGWPNSSKKSGRSHHTPL